MAGCFSGRKNFRCGNDSAALALSWRGGAAWRAVARKSAQSSSRGCVDTAASDKSVPHRIWGRAERMQIKKHAVILQNAHVMQVADVTFLKEGKQLGVHITQPRPQRIQVGGHCARSARREHSCLRVQSGIGEFSVSLHGAAIASIANIAIRMPRAVVRQRKAEFLCKSLELCDLSLALGRVLSMDKSESSVDEPCKPGRQHEDTLASSGMAADTMSLTRAESGSRELWLRICAE